MKRVYLLIIAVIALSVQYSHGAITDYTPEKKLTFGAEKDKQIIEAAKRVCAIHAPNFDLTGLVPVIYNFNMGTKPSSFGERDIVSVKFMKDVNDISRFVVFDEPKTVRVRKRANAVIHVEIFPDTMEPAGIGEITGTLFLPNYQAFCKRNPNFKFKKQKVSKESANIRSINEITKEELEKQGNKVTFDEKSKSKSLADNFSVEEWEKDGYKVIIE